MKLYDFTNKKSFIILGTESRKADISSFELCEIHKELGKLLGYQIIENCELIEIEINHVQGRKIGFELKDKKNIFIFALMKSGLYIAEGLRSVFKESSLFLVNNEIPNLDNIDLSEKTLFIADSVINTGKSIERTIESIFKKHYRFKRVIVVASVVQEESIEILKDKDIELYAVRISKNKYIGKGNTDTGNRLYNTIFIE